MSARRHLLLDVFEELIVIGHVLDHVVADHEVEVVRRQLGRDLTVGSDEDGVEDRRGDSGDLGGEFDAAVLAMDLGRLARNRPSLHPTSSTLVGAVGRNGTTSGRSFA